MGRNPAPRRPTTGDLVRLTQIASIEFRTPITVRVVEVLDWPTMEDWTWLSVDVIRLDTGKATVRRNIFVKLDGLVYLNP